MKIKSSIQEALQFDDVLLMPGETNVKPAEVSTKTRLTKTISLNIPLVASGRGGVTESAMAIAIAQLGGIGIIHDNMPMGKQVEEVRRVKRSEGHIVSNPITVAANASVAEAIDLMTTYKISGLPVLDAPTQKVVGILTARDVRFFEDYAKPVSDLMTKDVISVKGMKGADAAKRLMHQHRIEKVVVLDDQGRCIGLVTHKDIEKAARYPDAARDSAGRLRVGAAVKIGKDAFDRTAAMTDAGLDVVFIDVAQAHTRDVIGTVSRIRQQRSSEVQIVAGNVATPDAARSLVDAGADAIKIGIGACAHSTPRRAAGIGMPQFSAIVKVAEQCAMMGIPAIAEGGIDDAATLAKALGAGAECAAIVAPFAGTNEAPGRVVWRGGAAYKTRTGETKPAAGDDPYRFEAESAGGVPYRGELKNVVDDFMHGLRYAMAYTGSKDIQSLIDNAEFARLAK